MLNFWTLKFEVSLHLADYGGMNNTLSFNPENFSVVQNHVSEYFE